MSLKQEKILKLLYRSFDDILDEEEQQELAEALRNSRELEEERGQIEMQRNAISQSGSGLSFKPFFAERVMKRISGEDKKENYAEIFFESLFTLFKRVAVIGAAACIVIIAYNLAKGESLKAEDAFYVSRVTYEEILDMPLF